MKFLLKFRYVGVRMLFDLVFVNLFNGNILDLDFFIFYFFGFKIVIGEDVFELYVYGGFVMIKVVFVVILKCLIMGKV